MIAKRIFFVSLWLSAVLTASAQQAFTLKHALEVSKANNPFLKSAALNIPIAKADIVTAGLRPNPVLNNQTLFLANSSNFAPDTKVYNPKNRQVWWQLTKQFQMSHQREYKIEVAEKNAAVAGNAYTDAERNVLLDAGTRWLDAWLSSVNLELINEAKSNIDTLVQANEIRLKNQVISLSEFTRTQLLSDQYLLQQKSATQAYLTALKNLVLVTGMKDTMAIDTSDPVISMAFIDKADSLIQLSFQHRGDVLAAIGSIDAAKSNIRLQKAFSKPVPELGFIWNPQNTVPYFGVFGTIELPFFSRNQGEIRKSKVVLQQTEQSLYALQQQVRTEVQTSYDAYKLSSETVNKYTLILQRAEQVLQSVKYAYTRGGTTIIDFLDAQRTWFDTQKNYYDAVYTYRKNYLQLLYVTGLINQL